MPTRISGNPSPFTSPAPATAWPSSSMAADPVTDKTTPPSVPDRTLARPTQPDDPTLAKGLPATTSPIPSPSTSPAPATDSPIPSEGVGPGTVHRRVPVAPE